MHLQGISFGNRRILIEVDQETLIGGFGKAGVAPRLGAGKILDPRILFEHVVGFRLEISDPASGRWDSPGVLLRRKR